MNSFHLELTGHLLPGADPERACASLAKLLRTSPEQARALLRGNARRFATPLPHERAELVRRSLEQAGVGCRIEPMVASATPAAAAFRKPATLQVESDQVECPKCGHSQPPTDICQRCGIVFEKYRAAERRRQLQASAAANASASASNGASNSATGSTTGTAQTPSASIPYRLLNQLALLLFLSSLALALWSHWRKEEFPPPSFYDLGQLEEPRQTATDLEPFHVEAEGIRYLIEPLFDYALDGVVVSLHDSDSFMDIYHIKDWKDFLNIRDLCVVWGENVASGAFRDMDYKNTTWTCWISTQDPVAAASFNWQQLSNNHVLAHEPHLYEAIKSAEIGDQIHFSGQLARYSHDGGFQRGTSTSRSDTGNGACETVYVEDFRIVRKSNPGWRLAYRLSSMLAFMSLIALTVLLFVAPYRPHR